MHRAGVGIRMSEQQSSDQRGDEAAPPETGHGSGLFNALSERDGADSAVKDVFSLSEGKPV